MQIGQLMHALDVSVDQHNYSLALTEGMEIAEIHTECKGRYNTTTIFVSRIIKFNETKKSTTL